MKTNKINLVKNKTLGKFIIETNRKPGNFNSCKFCYSKKLEGGLQPL